MFLLLVLLFSTVTSLNLASVPLRPRLSEAPKLIKIKSQLGISSLLKLTEKQVNNETRDGLLDILQKAVMENDGALLACNEITTKLAAAGVGVARAIIANDEEKKTLNEAAAANVRAQTANAEEKTNLDLSKAAFSGLKALIAQLGADLADPSGEILEINAANEAKNAAALVDNGKEAVALTEAAEAIKAALANNAKELETLQSDKAANAAAVAANAAEKERLDETARAILKIKEVVDANSDPKKEVKRVDCDSSAPYYKVNVPFGFDLSKPFLIHITFNTALDWVPSNGVQKLPENPRNSGGIFGFRNLVNHGKEGEVKSLMNFGWGEEMKINGEEHVKYFRAYFMNDDGGGDAFGWPACMATGVKRGQDYKVSIGWNGETLSCTIDGKVVKTVPSSAGFGTWPQVKAGMGRYMNHFCWATGGGDEGWKGTIKDFVVVEDVWKSDAGACRGGPNWPGQESQWKCLGYISHHDCQKRCAESSDCGAYDIVGNVAGDSSCCLFAKGNKGLGEGAKVCYLKPE